MAFYLPIVGGWDHICYMWHGIIPDTSVISFCRNLCTFHIFLRTNWDCNVIIEDINSWFMIVYHYGQIVILEQFIHLSNLFIYHFTCLGVVFPCTPIQKASSCMIDLNNWQLSFFFSKRLKDRYKWRTPLHVKKAWKMKPSFSEIPL